jgi:hypothetical protein
MNRHMRAMLLRRGRRRRVFVTLLALMLVAMQAGAQWHELTHVGEWLQQPHQPTLQLPQPDEGCALCTLFAGGSAAAPARVAVSAPNLAGWVPPSFYVFFATATAPSFYLSRAPPLRS